MREFKNLPTTVTHMTLLKGLLNLGFLVWVWFRVTPAMIREFL